MVEEHYPLRFIPSQSIPAPDTNLKILAAWAGESRLADLSAGEYAFLDTETTGLSGGTGTYAFLVGVGRFEGDHFHLAQFFMRDPADEPALLLALEEFLAPCQALVTFNGKTFDAPLINTRYQVHGWRTPLASLGHVDLLHLSRRLWRDRLPSRTLTNLEVQILGSERTTEDIPGWAIPQMYFEYLQTGDAAPLKSIFYHNAMDIVSLAALFNHIAVLLAAPLETPLQHGVDRIALGKLYEDLGEIDTAIQLYMQGLQYEDSPDSPIPTEFRLSRPALLDAIQRLALIHKRRDNFQEAVPLWEKAARAEHVEAHIELAKFYEHRLANYSEALHWTETALRLVNAPGFPHYDRLRWNGELEHRIARLQHKIQSDIQT